MAERQRQPESNRRRHERQLVCVPTDVESDQSSQHIALIRDLSISGAYFLTRRRFEIDTRLDLTIHLSGDSASKTKQVSGTVVRTSPLEIDRSDLWSCGIAVEFDSPLEGMDEEIDALAERLKRTGLFDS